MLLRTQPACSPVTLNFSDSREPFNSKGASQKIRLVLQLVPPNTRVLATRAQFYAGRAVCSVGFFRERFPCIMRILINRQHVLSLHHPPPLPAFYQATYHQINNISSRRMLRSRRCHTEAFQIVRTTLYFTADTIVYTIFRPYIGHYASRH